MLECSTRDKAWHAICRHTARSWSANLSHVSCPGTETAILCGTCTVQGGHKGPVQQSSIRPHAVHVGVYLSPEDLDANQSYKHESRHRQRNQDPLQSVVDSPSQQAVGGEAAAGHSGKGKLSGIEDPVNSAWSWDVDVPQESRVLQPQVESLQVTSRLSLHSNSTRADITYQPLSNFTTIGC